MSPEPRAATAPAYQASWEIWHACNYRCPYCFFIPGWRDHPEYTNNLHKSCSPDDWRAFWRRLAERYGRFDVYLSGGEPSAYPAFFPLLTDVAERHRVRVVTNLSWDPSAADRLDPASVRFMASFHPDYADEAFWDRLRRLRDRGFDLLVTAVAYPPHFERLPEFERRSTGLGVRFIAAAFQGAFEGRRYPDAYTPAEREWLRRSRADPDGELDLALAEASPEGRPCGAGARYFRAYPDGSVYRCISVKDMAGARPLGTIRDPGFSLLGAPAPCPARRCLCPVEYIQLAPGPS